MALKFSDNLVTYITNTIKQNYLPKEEVYNYIERLEKDGYYPENKFIASYARGELDIPTMILEKYEFRSLFKKQFSDEIKILFKKAKNSDFISAPDLDLIHNYIEYFIYCIVNPPYGMCKEGRNIMQFFKDISESLTSKLGVKFKDLEEYYDIKNIKKEINKISEETIATNDTHRYSDETVNCFSQAFLKDDYKEAISECQYELHKVVVTGVSENILHDHTEL